MLVIYSYKSRVLPASFLGMILKIANGTDKERKFNQYKFYLGIMCLAQYLKSTLKRNTF